jgi:hypothetical protein
MLVEVAVSREALGGQPEKQEGKAIAIPLWLIAVSR